MVNMNLENLKNKRKNIIANGNDKVSAIEVKNIYDNAKMAIKSGGFGKGGTQDDLAFLNKNNSTKQIQEVKNEVKEDLQSNSDAFFKALKNNKKKPFSKATSIKSQANVVSNLLVKSQLKDGKSLLKKMFVI